MCHRAGRTLGLVRNQFEATIGAPPERVRPLLADLTRYPDFLDIVHRVEPDTEPGPDGVEAWWVTLRARIGPLARSKRLRMVRTEATADRIRFERSERDGREHSAWVLEATLAPTADDATTITMALDYGGRLWSGAVGAVLEAEVPEATNRLESLATPRA